MVAEEHELAAGTEQPVRSPIQAIGSHQIAAPYSLIAKSNELSGWATVSGVAVYPFDVVESVEIAQAPRRGQLGLGVVDGVHRRAPTPHRRRHITGPAP